LIEYQNNLFRLRTFYLLLVDFLSIHFSGDVLITSQLVNRMYLKLTIRIDEIVKQDGFEPYAHMDWKPFDNLLYIHPKETEEFWENTGRKQISNFQSEIEDDFIRNGEKQFDLNDDDKRLISEINQFFEQYKKEKKENRSINRMIEELTPYFKNNQKGDTIKSEITDEELHLPVLRQDFADGLRIFISHKFVKRDQELAFEFQRVLLQNEINGYLAERKREYELLIREKIKNEIERSDYLVAIVTETSIKSPSVNEEIGYALGRKVPVVILLEKNVNQGVLTHGMEPEIFTRTNFKEHIQNVMEYIVKNGARKKLTEGERKELIVNVYRPCYNSMKNIYDRRNFITEVPDNKWRDLEHYWKLNTESDMKNLFEEYSKQLTIWHNIWVDFGNKYQRKQKEFHKFVEPIFAKFNLLDDNQNLLLRDGDRSIENWFNECHDIIFDDTVQDRNTLYENLKNYTVQKWGERHSRIYDVWFKEIPAIYDELLKIVPTLVKELDADYTYEELNKQRNILKNCIEKLTIALEEKIR